VAIPLNRSDGVWIAGVGLLATLVGLLAGIDPRIAIGVSFGLGFLVLAFADLATGLLLFLLISFLEFVLPGGSVLSLTKLAGLVITLSWLARVVSNPREKLFFSDHPAATAILVALLGWGGLSILWSEDTGGTILDFSRYLQVFALLVITYSAVRTRDDARRVLLVFLFGVAIMAAWALVERPNVDPGQIRLTSTVGDANAVAAFLVAGMAIAAALAIAGRRASLARVIAAAAITLMMATFIITGSRSGVLALSCVLIASVAFAGRRKPQALAVVLVAAVAAALVFVTFAPASIKERISETTPGQASPEEGRRSIWEVGWRMFEAQPVRGVGLGSFRESSIHYVLEPGALQRSDAVIDVPEEAHNVYLQVAAEMGLVGEVLFLLVLGFPLICTLRAARTFADADDREMEIYARALAVAIVAFYVSNFFQPWPFNKVLWVLLGTGPAMLAIARAQLADRGQRRPDAA
jgi:putative inorganic carbon (HCO3(-)) transporter